MITAEDKGKFRQRKVWTEFRREMRKLRKVDPITGSKLTKTYNLHHLSQNSKYYCKLDPDRFECLNNQTHDVVHAIFGCEGKLKNWRLIVLRLITVLKKMEKLTRQDDAEDDL